MGSPLDRPKPRVKHSLQVKLPKKTIFDTSCWIKMNYNEQLAEIVDDDGTSYKPYPAFLKQHAAMFNYAEMIAARRRQDDKAESNSTASKDLAEQNDPAACGSEQGDKENGKQVGTSDTQVAVVDAPSGSGRVRAVEHKKRKRVMTPPTRTIGKTRHG